MMARKNKFMFVCDDQEREMLSEIAEKLERSQSDAVRYLVREANKRLTLDLEKRALAQ